MLCVYVVCFLNEIATIIHRKRFALFGLVRHKCVRWSEWKCYGSRQSSPPSYISLPAAKSSSGDVCYFCGEKRREIEMKCRKIYRKKCQINMIHDMISFYFSSLLYVFFLSFYSPTTHPSLPYNPCSSLPFLGPHTAHASFPFPGKVFWYFLLFFRRVGFFFHVFFLHSLSHCCCSKTTTSERERRDEINVGVGVDGLVFWPISREGWKMSLYLYNVESSNISKGWFFLLFSIFSLWAREQRVS